MLVSSNEAGVLAKSRNLRWWRAREWSSATVVDWRRRALESLHEPHRRNPVVNERHVIAGAARPVLAQLGNHVQRRNVSATPGSDVSHDPAIGRCIVSRAVGVGTEAFAGDS